MSATTGTRLLVVVLMLAMLCMAATTLVNLATQVKGILPAGNFTVATTCPTCVVASSPGVGIAHFAGSTQTVTSSAVNLAGADVTGVTPILNGGTGVNTLAACELSPNISAVNFNPSAVNRTDAWGFIVTMPCTFSKIEVVFATADTAAGSSTCPNLAGSSAGSRHCYDWGVFNHSGTLIADVGPHQVSSNIDISLTIAQGTVTLTPGLYFWGWTGDGTAAAIYVSPAHMTFANRVNESQATSGGQLVNFTPVADSWSQGAWPLAALHQ